MTDHSKILWLKILLFLHGFGLLAGAVIYFYSKLDELGAGILFFNLFALFIVRSLYNAETGNVSAKPKTFMVWYIHLIVLIALIMNLIGGAADTHPNDLLIPHQSLLKPLSFVFLCVSLGLLLLRYLKAKRAS